MIFNSFIAANDYNFVVQLTKQPYIFLLINKTFEGSCLAVAESFLQKALSIFFFIWNHSVNCFGFKIIYEHNKAK